MHPRTRELFANLPGSPIQTLFSFGKKTSPALLGRKANDILSRKRAEYLRNAYAGETAYILTCGPSLSAVWDQDLKAFLQDKLVISVKQAHELAPEMSDFHIYNAVRMQGYEYPSTTFRVSVWKYLSEFPSHIHFPLLKDHNWNTAIIRTNEYEKWADLANNLERPLGTGVMFEVGLFLPIFLGCKRMVIFGFDMNAQGKYHFYRPGDDDSKQFARPGECEYAQQSIPYFLDWCESIGVEVASCSPQSALSIPQVSKQSVIEAVF